MNLILDIETRALPEAELISRFAPTFEAPQNYKDPVKIAAAVQEKRESWLEDSTLRAERSRILVLGFSLDGGETVLILHGENESDDILWPLLELLDFNKMATVCGFNLLGFDLPFIRRRCILNKIPFPFYDHREKWNSWAFKTYDPMLDWQCGNRQDSISLDTLAKALGFEGKNGDWRDFANLYDTDREKALDYLRNDVRKTAKVIGAMRG